MQKMPACEVRELQHNQLFGKLLQILNEAEDDYGRREFLVYGTIVLTAALGEQRYAYFLDAEDEPPVKSMLPLLPSEYPILDKFRAIEIFFTKEIFPHIKKFARAHEEETFVLTRLLEKLTEALVTIYASPYHSRVQNNPQLMLGAKSGMEEIEYDPSKEIELD